MMAVNSLFDLINVFAIILLFVVTLLSLLLLSNKYKYWEVQGVPGPKPVWFIGNMLKRLKPTLSLAHFDQILYQKYAGKNYCGYYEFTRPVLMVGDPELLKHIMIKDFDHFTDRSFEVFNEPVMDHMLLGLKGPTWKAVRSVMTPTFSSGKIKRTVSLVKDCSQNLIKYFQSELSKGHSVFEMKEVYGMFTMDTIASIAFGVNSDSLNNTENEFSAAAAKFFKPLPAWKRPFLFFQFLWPRIAKLLNIDILDKAPIHFFSKVVSDTMMHRLENGITRNDFLQLLLDARAQELLDIRKQRKNATSQWIENGSHSENASENNPVLTELIITAQCVLFYIAGYDTTATTLSFVSYCLAVNPSIQQRVMEEIEEVLARHGGNISYEALQEMSYLDMVFAAFTMMLTIILILRNLIQKDLQLERKLPKPHSWSTCPLEVDLAIV